LYTDGVTRTRSRKWHRADLLPVDGDPPANIQPIEDPARNLVVIMKDGRICTVVLT
jgi:imidazolonepropionase-like amidohydrolase